MSKCLFELKCREMLTCNVVLPHYDSTKLMKLACNTSAYGLGAVLSHTLDDEEHPVAFTSRHDESRKKLVRSKRRHWH